MKHGVLSLLALAAAVGASAQTGSLRGQVIDESGALVPRAKVTLLRSSGSAVTVNGSDGGSYAFLHLAPGAYIVQATAPNLVLRPPLQVTIGSGAETLNLTLTVLLEKQQVTVTENNARGVSTEPANNAGALVIAGSDLDALPDNLDDLAADLQALAGPAAGPSGGAIFIDGFSGGQLPPKNTIREIRINQNPFSSEYDRLGFGRIEIFTKPGTDKFHADLGYNFATDKWNSRNPYAAPKAPFRLHEFREGASGPLGKRASFNLTFMREWVDNGYAVNAVTLDPGSLTPVSFTDVPVASLDRTWITPRLDYQLSANHTLSVRYSYTRDDVSNAGIGGFNLLSRGFRNDARSHTLQATETAVIAGKIVNETRFQFSRPSLVATANTRGAAVNVLNAFSGGGAPVGDTRDRQANYEFQNYTSMLRGRNSWRFGLRLREASETSVSPQNFGGTFTFGGGLAPALNALNEPVLTSAGEPVMTTIDSLERYRRTLLFQRLGVSAGRIRLLGGGATQFTVVTGDPLASAGQFDVGAFVGDDFRARPDLTLSLGLRYEAQTNVDDWWNFAPRIAVAWAPGAKSAKAKPRNVIRSGFGIFYDRFALAHTLAARRFNGVVQQQYVVTDPDFFPSAPPTPALAGASASSSAVQQIDPALRAPYVMQAAIGFERELRRDTTVSFTYARTRGLHVLRSRDVNAPLPGTYSPQVLGSGVYPQGTPRHAFSVESTGVYDQSQWTAVTTSRLARDFSVTATYQYNRAMSDSDGAGTFPANPYSMQGEYGPAATDVRHRVSLVGTLPSFWGIRLNPMLTANSGPPFDITVGHDLFGTSLFNGRPAPARDPSKPGVVVTPYGLLDPNPAPGQQPLPRNYGRGPGQLLLNARIGRTFRFGLAREGAAAANTGGSVAGAGTARETPATPFGLSAEGRSAAATRGRRFSLTVSMQVRNVTNHNNPGPIIGNIASPLFGRANQPAGSGGAIFSENANNRRLELQTRLTF